MVCFVCAQKYAFVAEEAVPEISMHRAFTTSRQSSQGGCRGEPARCPSADDGANAPLFLGLSASGVENIMGMATYKDNYACTFGNQEESDAYDLQMRQWCCRVTVPVGAFGRGTTKTIGLLCCPEDAECENQR